MSFDYDLFVIGGGSGGVRAARIAASHGARVGLAEEYRMGGTCVIRGCVPKKLMVYASHFSESFEDAQSFGWEVGETRFNWQKFIAHKDAEIDRLEKAYSANLQNSGVESFAARATLTGPHEVTLSTGQSFSAKHILIATGGAPFVPDIPGADLGITSNEIFHLTDQPRRIAIIGGGYIACEFAGIMNGLGSEVHLIYRGPHLLRGFDRDIRTTLEADMAAKGITIHLNANPASLKEGLTLTLDTGETLQVDQVLWATGRKPNSAGLGLEDVGVGLRGNGAIEVDSWSQTVIPSVHAVGDVTDRVALTPVAIREGHAFADTLFGPEAVKFDHANIASAVFTQPEAATVGLTEEEAEVTHGIEIYRARFRAMMHAFADREERMMMKLVVDKADRRVLGVHIVGHGAAEMIQMAAIAVNMGATKEDFDATVAVHPTAAEELVTMRTPIGG